MTMRYKSALNSTILSKNTIGLTAFALAHLAVAGFSSNTHAAENDTDHRQNLALEEVIVTVQRREQSLQKTAISASAFSGEDLSDALVNDLGDVQALVPNLSLTEGDSSNAVLYIRGVGQRETISFADPGVGVYLDDVYMGRAQGSFLDVLDVQRIEVLRGPQGTLYGRNTIGGALKYISKKPTDEFTASIETSVGSYNRKDIKASIGGSIISDRLMGRLNVAKLTRDGFTENLYDGKDLGDKNSTALRAALLWDASDSVSVNLAYDQSSAKPDSARPPILEKPGLLTPGTPTNDPYIANVNFADYAQLNTQGIAATVNWGISELLDFKSVSSYRKMDWAFHFDVDATPLQTVDVFVDDEQQSQVSQEFLLTYSNDRITALGGLFYFNEKDVTSQGNYSPDVFFGIGIYNVGENDFNNTSSAIFGQVELAINDKLNTAFGLRYTKEEKMFNRTQNNFGDLNFDGVIDVAIPNSLEDTKNALGSGISTSEIDDSNTWSDISPKFSLDYSFDNDAMLFASVAKGFKSGGFFGRSDGNSYDQEQLWAYEIGFKSKWLDNRLKFNAALFYNDYKDLQLTIFALNETGLPTSEFQNAGKAKFYGGEIELAMIVTDALTVDFNVGYLESEFIEYKTVDRATGETLDVSDTANLPFAPTWDSKLGLNYALYLSGYTLSARTDVGYRSKTYFEVLGNTSQEGYTLANASLVLAPNSQNWQLILSAKNLTDKAYRDFAYDLTSANLSEISYYGEPRTFALTGRYNF